MNQPLPSRVRRCHRQQRNHLLRYSLNFPREIAVKLNGLIPLYLPRLFALPPLSAPSPFPRLSSRNLVGIITNDIDLMTKLCFD